MLSRPNRHERTLGWRRAEADGGARRPGEQRPPGNLAGVARVAGMANQLVSAMVVPHQADTPGVAGGPLLLAPGVVPGHFGVRVDLPLAPALRVEQRPVRGLPDEGAEP